MKLSTISASALLTVSLMNAGAATAYSIVDIDSTVSTAAVMFSVDGGVATLTGHVDGHIEKDTLERNAAQLQGVEKVRNFLSVSR